MNNSDKNWLDAWHVNPSANREYDVIDGVRGIAILLVVLSHLLYTPPQTSPFLHYLGGLFSAGGSGVIVFFALSGFLIAWPFWKRKVNGATQAVPSGYGWRRFWKIYPPLALSVIVLTPLYVLQTNDSSYVQHAIKWLFGWPLILPISGDLNPVMWSLVVEVQFYIVLPLLFAAMKRLPAKATLWWVTLGFVVVPEVVRWINHAHGISATIHPDINVRFPTPLDAFALGVMVAGLESLGLITRKCAWLGDLGLGLLALALLAQPLLNQVRSESFLIGELYGWSLKIASGLLLFYIANPQNPRARLLARPWLCWCGVISYEWYLFHQPISLWAHNLIGPAGGNLLRYGLTAAGAGLAGLGIGALVYWFYSLPILKRGRARHSRRPTPPPPVTAAQKSDLPK